MVTKNCISSCNHATQNINKILKGDQNRSQQKRIFHRKKHFYLISISCDGSLHEDIEIDVWSRKESQISIGFQLTIKLHNKIVLSMHSYIKHCSVSKTFILILQFIMDYESLKHFSSQTGLNVTIFVPIIQYIIILKGGLYMLQISKNIFQDGYTTCFMNRNLTFSSSEDR